MLVFPVPFGPVRTTGRPSSSSVARVYDRNCDNRRCEKQVSVMPAPKGTHSGDTSSQVRSDFQGHQQEEQAAFVFGRDSHGSRHALKPHHDRTITYLVND